MIWIILPVHNEGKTIESTIARTVYWCRKNLRNDFQIVFINDHSTDDTVSKIRKAGFEHIRLISNLLNTGKGSALRYGYIALKSEMKDADIVVFMDGDGQIDIDDIEVFIRLMWVYHADVVIGNKRSIFSISKYGFVRSIVSRTYNLIIRILFGFQYKDTQCGLKLFKKPVLDAVMPDITVSGFAFDLDILMALRKREYRIVDGPVKIGGQINKGSVSIKNIVHTFKDTIKIFLKYK